MMGFQAHHIASIKECILTAQTDPASVLIESIKTLEKGITSDYWIHTPTYDAPQKTNFKHALDWRDESLDPLPPAVSVEQVRQDLPKKLWDFIRSDKELLIVGVGAGVGKSHAAVQVLQEYAATGKRALWMAPRHDLFGTMSKYPHFRPHDWHHWMPMSWLADTPEAYCIKHKFQLAWREAGHKSIDLCKQICPLHIKDCLFRKQADSDKKLVFAMHQHLNFGVPFDFDLALIDENPINAIIKERLIKRDNLLIDDLIPGLKPLAQKLHMLCVGGAVLQGYQLIDMLKDELKIAFSWIDASQDIQGQAPRIFDENQVFDLPVWYWGDLLPLLWKEHQAYLNGWTEWNPRVKTGRDGVQLLDRHKLWDKLPRKVILLDATGDEALYRHVFSDWKIDTYKPHTPPKGKVMQITNRSYGSPAEGDKTDDLIQTIQHLRRKHKYKKVGIVCHKGRQADIKTAIRDAHTLYFYNLRGSNALEGLDALFVAGTPTPNQHAMIRQAIAITGEMTPLGSINERGFFEAEWSHQMRPYRVKNTQKTPYRMIGGYPTNPVLESFLRQYREGEIEQALHRLRIATHRADVWLLNPIPMETLMIDNLYERPPIDPQMTYQKRDGSLTVAFIPWLQWLKLSPVLDKHWQDGTPIGVNEMAAICSIKPQTVRTGKWVHVIAHEYGHLWKLEDDPEFSSKRGAKVQRLTPID